MMMYDGRDQIYPDMGRGINTFPEGHIGLRMRLPLLLLVLVVNRPSQAYLSSWFGWGSRTPATPTTVATVGGLSMDLEEFVEVAVSVDDDIGDFTSLVSTDTESQMSTTSQEDEPTTDGGGSGTHLGGMPYTGILSAT
jgi:hypothetical protein